MEMCYEGTLVMPSNYVVMDSEEMSYVDGGFYISNSLIKSMVITSCLNPVGATLVGLGIYKLVSYIALSGAKLGAKIGGIVGGVVGSCIGGLSGAAICGSAAWTVARALIEKKGIGVDFAYTSFGMPYCIDINIR